MEKYLIFFFSALGAFNGLLLSIYFAFIAEKKKFSNYFLAGLLFVLSIRIIKSVFFYFNPQLASVFIQIGLSGCILIGPFLYLYLKAYRTSDKVPWKIHVFPYLIAITILGMFYSYVDHRGGWSSIIVRGIYLQWLIYLLYSFKYVKPSLEKVRAKQKLSNVDIWILSIYIGVFVIWLAYNIGAYTSYIVGALSFSFVLYLIILLLIFKNSKRSTFFDEKEKYNNKSLEDEMTEKLKSGLANFVQQEMFLDANLTLEKMAKFLDVPRHILSQYLNEHVGKSFSLFINEFRIEKAKEYLFTKTNFTIEGIAYECGFNSKSTFYTTFKKIVGMTPAQYRKEKMQ